MMEPGLLFGYRPLADYGSYSDGLGNIYRFGRTRLKDLWGREVMGNVEMQKEMLVKRLNCMGLNKPSTILLWVYTEDVVELWDRMKRQLKGGWWRPTPVENAPPTIPIITNHLRLGDSWFSVENMGPADFGVWVREQAKQEAIDGGIAANFAVSRDF